MTTPLRITAPVYIDTDSGDGTAASPFVPRVAIPAGSNTPTLAAGENHVGSVGGNTMLGSVTPGCATTAIGAGSIAFNGTEIAGALRVSGGTGVLESVTVIDRDDQGIALDLVFTDGSASFGVLGAAPAAADVLGDKVLGVVHVAAADYVDLGNFRAATVAGINLTVKGNATTSLWVAALANGSATFTASGLTIKAGILQD